MTDDGYSIDGMVKVSVRIFGRDWRVFAGNYATSSGDGYSEGMRLRLPYSADTSRCRFGLCSDPARRMVKKNMEIKKLRKFLFIRCNLGFNFSELTFYLFNFLSTYVNG